MSSSAVAVVVVARTGDRHLLATLAGIQRQTAPPRELIVAVGPNATLAPPALSLMTRIGAVVLRLNGESSGALRNAAIRQTMAPLLCWIDEADVPAPGWLQRAADAITPQADFVAPLALVGSLVSDEGLLMRPATDLTELLSASDRIPLGGVVRRAVWNDLGGFDETLPALDEYDFWIRALHRGTHGRVVPERLMSRLADRPPSPEATQAAIHLVVTRHQSLFEKDPAAVIANRIRDRAHLDSQYVALMERQDSLSATLAANNREIEALEATLRERGAEGVDWGDLRSIYPVSSDWGYDRGTPVDRVYIEQFVSEWAHDVQGRVLEVQESDLTQRFGGKRVAQSDVIDINAANPLATIVADLRAAPHVASDRFDCIILTQTIHVIDDAPAVLREAYRLLKPGGVLLATLPSASRVCLEYGADGDFWRLTEAGARRLFETVFKPELLSIRAYGNVLTNVAFLLGLAAHELSPEEYAGFDPYFPLLIGVRAVKPLDGSPDVVVPARLNEAAGPVVLLYHRISLSMDRGNDLSVTPRLFRQHLEFVKSARRVLPLEEFIHRANVGDLPHDAVAFTFDDGYRDNLDTAAPILVDFGVPATFFVTTQSFAGVIEYWWDALQRALLANISLPDPFRLTIDGEVLSFATSTAVDRRAFHDLVHHKLVTATLEERNALVAELTQRAGVAPFSSMNPLLTPHEVQQLARLPGCSVGAHTVNHLALGYQPQEVVWRELTESRDTLAALVGQPIIGLAYPYGNVGSDTPGLAEKAGFTFAVTCDERPITTCDRFTVPRLDVKAWPVAALAGRLMSIAADR